MDKYFQRFKEEVNKSGRHFVFPKDDNADDVVNKVKEIVSSYTTDSATETETTEFDHWITKETTMPTILEEIDSNSTMAEVLTNNNGTEIMNNSNGTIVEVMNNANRTVMEVVNNATNTFVDVITGSNKTTLVGDAENNSTGFDEAVNSTTTEKHKLFDWMDTDSNHNLTMVHAGLPEMKPDGDQTAFIILGVVLGMLLAISFVLLLVYISFKRSNLYTLQERAESSQHRPIPLQVSSTDGRESEKDDTPSSGYKF